MIIGGYDTDDLTDRQNHYFHKLGRTSMTAYNFIAHCVKQNISLGMYDNYPGDCDWLLNQKPELLAKFGIDPAKIYN